MYHIFVLVALMASQNQVEKATKAAQLKTIKKTEQSIPSYPEQPKSDILDQFKKELAKEDEAINKMAKEDLESFGLDSVDNKASADDDFLNTSGNSDNIDNQKKTGDAKTIKKEATLTGSEFDENIPPEQLPMATPKISDIKIAQKKEDLKPITATELPEVTHSSENKIPTAPPIIVSEAKPNVEIKKVEEIKNADEAKKENVPIKDVFKKSKKTDIDADSEKKPIAKKKSRKQIIKEKRLAKLKAVYEAKEEKKLKKLELLRKQYLVEFDAKTDEQDLALDEFQRISSIIPEKKLDPKIIDVEVPIQLLDRNRSNDNKYHPIIPTYKEKINFMFKAIAQGRVDDFNALFDTINQPNLQNSYGDTLLTFSILMQKHGAISSLLTKGANPNLPNKLLYKPMNLAIEMVDYKSVFLLSQMGADIDFVDELGRTYLMQAARVGSLPIVDLLISKGVDINKEDKNGMTALGIAYRYNKDIIVKYLLKNGAKSWMPKNYQEGKKSLIEELEHRWD